MRAVSRRRHRHSPTQARRAVVAPPRVVTAPATRRCANPAVDPRLPPRSPAPPAFSRTRGRTLGAAREPHCRIATPGYTTGRLCKPSPTSPVAPASINCVGGARSEAAFGMGRRHRSRALSPTAGGHRRHGRARGRTAAPAGARLVPLSPVQRPNPGPLPAQARLARSSEPILIPKLRI